MMVTRDRQFPLSTPMSTVATVISIWIITTLISCPPLLGWGEFSTNSLGVRYNHYQNTIRLSKQTLGTILYHN